MTDLTHSAEKLDDYRLNISGKEYIPIVQGGMGVDISTEELALQVAECGGIGTISDALVQSVSDKKYDSSFASKKREANRASLNNPDKSQVKFDLHDLYQAQINHIGGTMSSKSGPGDIFVNIMEKLTMGDATGTLRARLHGAMDGGIDGITLSAGLHLNSFKIMEDNPWFRKVKLGIIISSARALSLFIRKCKRVKRLPDYIVVEGPLAGGHLGFGEDWKSFSLMVLLQETLAFLEKEELNIPLIPAGGIFTGTDAVNFIKNGASAVQVATRFTVSKECGLPSQVKQKYFEAEKEDIVVNNTSPTGYLMRMLKSSPSIGSRLKPNCEALGYLLDDKGKCSYVDEYYKKDGSKDMKKTCLCTNMASHRVWTCGQNAFKLKDTSVKNESGEYQLLNAKDVFEDYQYSTHHKIVKPENLQVLSVQDK